MGSDETLAATAELFRTLGNASRLRLLLAVADRPRTVGALVEETGMTQPLVSQHLRTLRTASLVIATRHGREMVYELADRHVSHVVTDALSHVQEAPSPARETPEGATP